MKILLCCEFYYPSVGGVQVVMQQLAEHFTAKGHMVTVATTYMPNRNAKNINGVKIIEFSISGNHASGIMGDLSAYQNFVTQDEFEVIMIKAAQQWTFDALWPVLDKVKATKVFIPCGFSGLDEPGYANYFKLLPDILRKFDHLIFYATNYRDINFTKEHGITNYSIVPNGASEVEFSSPRNSNFRTSLGISDNEFLLLTVGSMTGLKGHLEVAKAFNKMNIGKHKVTLLLNGNKCNNYSSAVDRIRQLLRLYGIKYTAKHALKVSLRKIGIPVGKDDELITVITQINNQCNKNVIITDLQRSELVQAFMATDLFVFASNVEYSPLVLYEAAAAGTPFLSVPVGNSEEIAVWTGAGVICPANKDEKGYTRVAPEVLASYMENLLQQPELLQKLGETGKKNWQDKFTWTKISEQYESIFNRLVENKLTNEN